mgnify:CR=1 FL=1
MRVTPGRDALRDSRAGTTSTGLGRSPGSTTHRRVEALNMRPLDRALSNPGERTVADADSFASIDHFRSDQHLAWGRDRSQGFSIHLSPGQEGLARVRRRLAEGP